MHDPISGEEIESFHEFNSCFAPTEDQIGAKARASIMRNAYDALVALERGRRTEYLVLRRVLAEEFFDSDSEPSQLYFIHDETPSEFTWPDMMLLALSSKAAALGFEAEESSWECIAAGQSRIARMWLTEQIWCQALNGQSSDYNRAVIGMMDYRFGQVISTGSRKQPLISILLASQPELRGKFSHAAAKYEAARLNAATRRQRRTQAADGIVKDAPASVAPSTAGQDSVDARPEVSLRL